MKEITEEQKAMLKAPLPAEAVSQHPSKTFLSTIKAIYVEERLNDVFGVGAWQIRTDFVCQQERMVVCKTILTIPEYNIYYESFGGSDNADLGDAYKGATTDAITKIGSYMGIGELVFKGLQTAGQKPQANYQAKAQQPAQTVKTTTGSAYVTFEEISAAQSKEDLKALYERVQLNKSENARKALMDRLTRRKKELGL